MSAALILRRTTNNLGATLFGRTGESIVCTTRGQILEFHPLGEYAPIAAARVSQEDAIMGLSSRYYLFAEDGVHRIAKRVVDGLVQGIDALPNYASTTQKAAAVTIENDAKGVARIINTIGEFWHFDEVGKINKSLQQAADSSPSRTVIPIHRGRRSCDCGQFLKIV